MEKRNSCIEKAYRRNTHIIIYYTYTHTHLRYIHWGVRGSVMLAIRLQEKSKCYVSAIICVRVMQVEGTYMTERD